MKKLIVLTGAGMSAESGLSTFRSSNGLWENHRVEDVATPEGWYRNPELVLDFYNGLRKTLIKSEPNAGHKKLAELESDYEVHIITQNVDNLQLSDEIVESVKNGLFHIYSISTIEEGIEVLTGVPAGKKDKNGNFPAGTVNYLVHEKLKKYAEISEK